MILVSVFLSACKKESNGDSKHNSAIASDQILCSTKNTMDDDFFDNLDELLSNKRKPDESTRKLEESLRKYEEMMMSSPEGRKALEEMRKENAREQERIDQALTNIRNRVRSSIEGECVVIYDAFSYDDDMAIDNLDDIAIKGRVRVEDEIYETYTSKILTDPTWLELTIEANRMMIASKDHHHIYFENFDVVSETSDGIKILSLFFGS